MMAWILASCFFAFRLEVFRSFAFWVMVYLSIQGENKHAGVPAQLLTDVLCIERRQGAGNGIGPRGLPIALFAVVICRDCFLKRGQERKVRWLIASRQLTNMFDYCVEVAASPGFHFIVGPAIFE